jgi:hypothetical protein
MRCLFAGSFVLVLLYFLDDVFALLDGVAGK